MARNPTTLQTDSQPPLRVLHLISQLTGGRGHLLANAAPYWTANGIQTTLIVPGTVLPKLQKGLEGAGVALIRPTSDPMALISRMPETGPFDVIHLHDRGNHIHQAKLVRRWHKGPIVFTIHVCGKPPALKKRLVTSVLRHWVQKRYRVTFVSCSADVQAFEKQVFGVTSRCIPNWIMPDLFVPPSPEARSARRTEWDIPGDLPAIATVGNCAPYKHHHLILEALGRLRKIRPDFLFLHAGQETQNGERELAESLDLGSNCRFLGRINDVPSLLQAADLYIMTSKREGLSLASIEAVSSGLPAVFTKSPGLNCLNGVFSGLHFEDPEPEALAKAIDTALREAPAFRTSQAGLNHEIACRLFSPQVGAAAYADLYRELLKKKAHS